MEQREKIVIPTGAESVETPESPHFVDDEATVMARPVVPLAPPAGSPGASLSASAGRFSPWLLALIILAAVSVGAAGAMALNYFRQQKQAQTPATEQTQSIPSATDARPAAQPVEHVAQTESRPATVEVSETEEQPATAADVPDEKGSEPVERSKASAARPDENADDKRKRQKQVSQPDNDEEKARKVDEFVISGDERPARERRRRRRERDSQNMPPEVRRTEQELHRIREIFEGRP